MIRTTSIALSLTLAIGIGAGVATAAAAVPAVSTQPSMTTAPAASAEAQFWIWFRANAPRLLDLIKTHDERLQGQAIDEVAEHLAKIKPGLTALFGERDKTNEIVISAEGFKDRFPAVKAVVAAAPPIEGWRVVAFKPRMSNAGSRVEYRGENLSTDDVWFAASPLPSGGLSLTMYVAGLTEANYERRAGAAVLLLDNTLGEYDAGTMIDRLDAQPLPADPQGRHLRRFSGLPAFIDARKPATEPTR